MTRSVKKSGRPRVKVYPQIKLPRHFKGTLFSQLAQHERVEIIGLGTFEVVKIKGREMYHNFSGKNRHFPAYNRLKFTQSKNLKAELV